jgi:hypothetical protein
VLPNIRQPPTGTDLEAAVIHLPQEQLGAVPIERREQDIG